jgi:hypothetical protein|tara:strand:+ start:2405 stop:2659 length:255 start_codon:yes stop_codon:yes gene_type:complete
MSELNKNDLEVICDVLNVYNPSDISHVYPKMGERQFIDGVSSAFKKVLEMIKEEKRRTLHDPKSYYWHPEEVANRKWCEQNKVS